MIIVKENMKIKKKSQNYDLMISSFHILVLWEMNNVNYK